MLPLDPARAARRARGLGGATVQGIDYAVMAKGNRRRHVKISMRKTRAQDTDALLIQATDVEREHELQHQVDDFFDTFDLKVDERVLDVLKLDERAQDLQREPPPPSVAGASVAGNASPR